MLMRYVGVCIDVCYCYCDMYDCDVCVFVIIMCNADKYNVDDVDECDDDSEYDEYDK